MAREVKVLLSGAGLTAASGIVLTEVARTVPKVFTPNGPLFPMQAGFWTGFYDSGTAYGIAQTVTEEMAKESVHIGFLQLAGNGNAIIETATRTLSGNIITDKVVSMPTHSMVQVAKDLFVQNIGPGVVYPTPTTTVPVVDLQFLTPHAPAIAEVLTKLGITFIEAGVVIAGLALLVHVLRGRNTRKGKAEDTAEEGE